ncbi:MAG TPA: RNA 2',3'-cyclic phosphodiesterase [Thermoanaerobaculia bacterium]|nr:RNA 2',3'-cyclic phosphodiesterase [Thermoanaerobaculia bacterium]
MALEISAGVRSEVGRRLETLRRRLPPARWVDPQTLHLTLVFLGETADARLPALAAGLTDACAAHPPFTMALAGGGTFPPGRPARVAWIGVAAGPELPSLQAAVAAAAAAAAGLAPIAPEDRPFTPHVTLARCREPWPREATETFAAAFAGAVGDPFAVTRGVLVASELGAGGARHRPVETFPLAAAAARP